jgi:hypothetical protein
LNRLDRWRTSPGDWLAGNTVGYDPVSRLASLVTDANGSSYDTTTNFAYNPASQIATASRPAVRVWHPAAMSFGTRGRRWLAGAIAAALVASLAANGRSCALQASNSTSAMECDCMPT